MNKETKAENLHVSPADGKPPVSSSYDDDYDEDYDDWEDDDYDEDYDDWEDDDYDPLESLAENCTCGAYILGKDGRYRHVADCCC